MRGRGWSQDEAKKFIDCFRRILSVDVARRLCAGMNDQSEIFVESSKVSDAGNPNNFQQIDEKKLKLSEKLELS